MAQTIKLKRSNTAGNLPTTSDLALGEVAINTKDGKFFLRKHVDGTDSGDAITAYAPQGLNVYGTQTFEVKVITKTASHPQFGTGSANGYSIDGLESPFIVLVPGNTYKFDQSDSSNTGHPLAFYLEEDKTTSYSTGVTTNGTPGSAGAYTEIVATDATPSVLHYQCSVHANMGNQATFGTRNLTGFDTDDLTEGSTNLYYTDARADARIALQVGANLDLSSKDTDDLSEGSTNLYYTDARARGAISVTDAGGDGSLAYNSSTGVI